jgi:DNA topoisomerase IB
MLIAPDYKAAAASRLDRSHLGRRFGNPEYAKENNSFGLTTLRRNHVRIEGGQIELDFRGKHGVHHHKVISDPTLARIIRNCTDLPGSELFKYIDEAGTLHRISSEHVNASAERELNIKRKASYVIAVKNLLRLPRDVAREPLFRGQWK